MVTHCCTSLKFKIGDIAFGLSCLCSLNCLGLSAFIYFGQVTKLLGLSFCVHQMLSLLSFTLNLLHISYWPQTQSVSFSFCWLVIGLFNKLQTNHKHSGKGMWCRCKPLSFCESIVWRAKRQLQRRHLDPFFAAFYLLIWLFQMPYRSLGMSS